MGEPASLIVACSIAQHGSFAAAPPGPQRMAVPGRSAPDAVSDVICFAPCLRAKASARAAFARTIGIARVPVVEMNRFELQCARSMEHPAATNLRVAEKFVYLVLCSGPLPMTRSIVLSLLSS